MLTATVCSLALALLGASGVPQPRDDWAAGPDASFMTSDERRNWKTLTTEAARDDFKRRYWQRRDPTPGTDGNEFQQQIEARIRTADERFGTRDQPGSRTARGMAYVLLGPPAIVRATAGPLDTALRSEFPRSATLPQTALDTTRWEEWVYDRRHNGELLKTLRRPLIEIAFVIERGRDQIQKPGLFAAYREAIARSTVVQP